MQNFSLASSPEAGDCPSAFGRTTVESNIVAPPLANRVEEACRRLGIGRSMLYQMIGAGEIKTIKIGCRTLVPETELQKVIASRLNSEAIGSAA